VHDSETVLSIDRLPERVVVVGAGPAGCEYASIFAALGVQVTLLDRAQQRPLRLASATASQVVAARTSAAGRAAHCWAQG
jgi:pyruvate/2-oxoglutarate dehydrogenase complex dihydrolipoamide dehydrogenase (E3) component